MTQKEYKHLWYLKNKDRILKERKTRYDENCEVINEKKRIRYNADEEFRKKYNEQRKKYKRKLTEIEKQRIKERNQLNKEFRKKYRSSFAKYDIYIDKIKTYHECRRDPINLELIQIRCKYCNKWFNPTIQQINNRITSIIGDYKWRGERDLYCSNSCKKSCPIYGKIKYPAGFKPASSREVQPEL